MNTFLYSSGPWVLLQFATQIFVGALHWRLVGKGRILTRPLWRIRFFRPPLGYFAPLYSMTRVKQVLIMVAVELPLIFTTHIRCAIYFALAIIALYLDDYFTGDDERWKRFKDRVKNAVKWKMTLPQPVRE